MQFRKTHAPAIHRHCALSTMLLATACLLSPDSSVAQDETASMRGTILDAATGTPLPGVMVYIPDQDARYTTGADGRFHLSGIAQGSHLLLMRKIGFTPRGFRFALSENHLGEIDLGEWHIERQVTQLETVIVEGREGGARLEGFYRRSRQGFGSFVTREDIERGQPRRSTDLLRTVPGVQVHCRGSDCQVGFTRQTRPPGQSIMGQAPGTDASTGLSEGQAQIARNTDNVAGDIRSATSDLIGSSSFFCGIRYFMDGVPFDGSRGINAIAPDLIEGIEIYKGPATVPARFGGPGATCGVIAIWTRRPGR
jgi:hypothetical protein